MTGDDDALFTTSPQAITFKIEPNAGIVLWSLINVTLGSYVALALLVRLKCWDVSMARRKIVLAFAALALSLGCWACELTSSRAYSAPQDPAMELFIGFDSGFVVLSLVVPTLIILGTFMVFEPRLIRDRSKRTTLWFCSICGPAVGLSAGFMHYALFLSLPSFKTTFVPSQVFLILLLSLSGSLSSFLIFSALVCRPYETKKRFYTQSLAIPSLVFGCFVVGAGFLAFLGTKLEPRGILVGELGESMRRQRDVLTLAIPLIISAVLLCSVVYLITVNESKRYNNQTFAPRLTLASIAFNSDGYVLVNGKEMLPTKEVDLQDLPKDILDELDIRHSTFHWLLKLSSDWSIASPFLDHITSISSSHDKRPSLWSSFFPISMSSGLALFNFKSQSCSDPSHTQARLKIRLLAAATQLATELDLPLSKLGTLHECALETGTRLCIAEFLLLSEQASSQLRDAENALKASADANKGLMLFFVRRLSHRPSSSGSAIYSDLVATATTRSAEDYEWQKKYLTQGYRMRFMDRFRDTLAEATGATFADVDKALHGCKDTATRKTRSVLEAGTTYVSLFTDRIVADGSSEVLVYDFAKHQLPSYRLGTHELTHEIRNWLRGMSGFTASDIIHICTKDVEQGRMHRSHSSHSSYSHGYECDEAYHRIALLEFKEALAFAIVQLMRDMSFVGEELSTWTFLTSLLLDVPSISSESDSSRTCAPAHMIILHAQEPDVSDPDGLENESDFTHFSRSSTHGNSQQKMPSVFEYTPRALFDVALELAIMSPPRESLRDEASRELERLLAAGTSARAHRSEVHIPGRRAGPGRLPHALVSSFSIDSFSDDGEGHRRGRGRSPREQLRTGWTAVKARARSLRLPRIRQNNKVPLPQSSSRTHIITHSPSASASTATTSTTSSIAEPLAAFYPHSRPAVKINSDSTYRNTIVFPDNRKSVGPISRSSGRATSKATVPSWYGSVRIPPTPYFDPDRRSRVTSKSVPNFADDGPTGYF